MKTVKQLLLAKGDHVHSTSPKTSVYDALEKMAQEEIGALLVLDDERLAGIVSERDYARKVILLGRISKETPVSDIMTHKVICVTSELSIEACMALMTDKRVRHLVIRESEEIAGIISIGDIIKAIIDDQQFTIQQLEHYISGGG